MLLKGAAVTISSFFSLRESYAYVILDRKASRLRKETGNPNLRSVLDTGRSPKELFLFSIVRPTKMLFLSPIVFLLSLYTAVIYGYLYLLFTTMTEVFEMQYGFSQGSVGLAYLGIGIGSLLGLFVLGAISDRLLQRLTKSNGGVSKPEYRLPPMFVGSWLIPLALFWYGWTAEKKDAWILPIIGTGFLGVGMIITFVSPCIFYPALSLLFLTKRTIDGYINLSCRCLHSLLCLGHGCLHTPSITFGCTFASGRGKDVPDFRPRLGQFPAWLHRVDLGSHSIVFLQVRRAYSEQQAFQGGVLEASRLQQAEDNVGETSIDLSVYRSYLLMYIERFIHNTSFVSQQQILAENSSKEDYLGTYSDS